MATEYLNNKTFETLIVKFQNYKREKIKYQLLMNDCIDSEARLSKRTTAKVSRRKNIENDYKLAISNFEEIQNELTTAFYILSENIVRYAKFNLIDQDDAVQEGVMICFDKIDRFDPIKGKAFNYMTTCVLNHFRQLYRTARSYNEFKKKYLDFIQLQTEQQLSQNKTKSLYKKHNIVTID